LGKYKPTASLPCNFPEDAQDSPIHTLLTSDTKLWSKLVELRKSGKLVMTAEIPTLRSAEKKQLLLKLATCKLPVIRG
jgi:hypothetical protein